MMEKFFPPLSQNSAQVMMENHFNDLSLAKGGSERFQEKVMAANLFRKQEDANSLKIRIKTGKS